VRFKILGFAGAAPLEGACSAYLVADGEQLVLLDCGPGALERVWREGALERLGAIVVSHMHLDHVADLPLIAGELVRDRLRVPRPALYVPRGDGPNVLRALDATFTRAQTPRTRFDVAFDVREYDARDRVELGALTLTFAPTAHAQPCFAARVDDGSAAIVYGADGSPSESLAQLAAGADVLVLEATYAENAAAAAAQGHMTAAQAGELARRAGAGRLVLTHLVPGECERVAELAAREFDGPVELAREGLEYELA
jgi:ribonuclease BN (tRNA processing enzyme)